MARYDDEEERTERFIADYCENMAISNMDPAEREYMESRRYTGYGEPLEEPEDDEPPEPMHETETAPWQCSNCGEDTWQLYRIDGDSLCRRCFGRRTDPTPDDTWAYANTQSILAVPESILPAGPAREELLALARAGQDCYAYAPIQLEEDPKKRRYNVWVRGRRYDVAEWLAAYASREEESRS